MYYGDTPVAELKKEDGKFLFRYFAEFFLLNLSPLPGLAPTKGSGYAVFDGLPPFFSERLPDTRRPEVRQWIIDRRIDENDELLMLSSLGARSITDPFELKLKKSAA
jgi:hypothetical protein